MIASFLVFIVTFFMLKLALPWLRDVAIAKVSDRSAHSGHIPQGGGLFILISLTLVALVYPPVWGLSLFLLLLALLLSLLGFVDDRLELSPFLRFMLQGIFVGATLWLTGLPLLLPHVPILAGALGFFGLLWYVNLSNFMDGIDWMSVLHISFVSFGLWLLTDETLFLMALGGILGFAPYNFPKAKLFMGDAGSLPFGLLLGAGLILAAQKHGLLPPLILTLYYVSDASITLLLRLLRKEKIWLPHKTHFYQKALKNLSIKAILVRLSLAHAALLGLSLLAKSQGIIALTLAICVVVVLLYEFTRART